ncbi:MAG TPA: YceI family protein [Steroidobacteraceae bacterium]|nr:YceI family protein [Steroidobacteraceae bacterium]
MPRVLRVLIPVAIAFALAGCPTAQRPEPAEPAPTQPGRPARDYSNARVYQVVPEESLVRILAYRAGTLASAGHNHLVASHQVEGKVYLHEEIARSGFELAMPVASLEIDPAELRKEEGPDFPPDVPDSARQGTRKNMLGAALLDAERFPDVRLSATAVEGASLGALTVTALVDVKDQQHEVRMPVAVQVDGDRLTASGEFKVKQSDLGLTPFSALMGALQVQDELTVKFKLVATR